jgi:hypothetical protein
LIWIGLNVQLVWICESDKSWKVKNPPQCSLGHAIAFTKLGVDTASDSVIIFVPAQFFWRSSLPIGKRIRLIAVFAISIITTIFGFSHTYFILYGPPYVENLNGILQSSISVIVCNLPVCLSSLVLMIQKIFPPKPPKPREVSKHTTAQFAGINTLEDRPHESHISGLTGLTGVTHITTHENFRVDPNYFAEFDAAMRANEARRDEPGTSETDLEMYSIAEGSKLAVSEVSEPITSAAP